MIDERQCLQNITKAEVQKLCTSFVWLANALQSLYLQKQSFCTQSFVSFVWREVLHEVLPPYKALLCKACKPKVCTKFCTEFCDPKLCFGTLRFAIQNFALVPLRSPKVLDNLRGQPSGTTSGFGRLFS